MSRNDVLEIDATRLILTFTATVARFQPQSQGVAA